MSDIKDHLIKAVRALLEDEFDADQITVRQIAYEAHVATGLVNYHFGSKWNLIVAAISAIIEDAARESFEKFSNHDDPPPKKLRAFLKAMAVVVCEYKNYTSYLIRDELLSSRFSTPETILDLLGEIKPELSSREIKYMAIQIVAPIQYIFLKEAGLANYLSDEVNQLDVSKQTKKMEKDKHVVNLMSEYDFLIESILKSLNI